MIAIINQNAPRKTNYISLLSLLLFNLFEFVDALELLELLSSEIAIK